MDGLLEPKSAALKTLLRVQKYILVIASLVMAVTFFLVVILRYVFQADLFAYEEWILVIAFWLYFLGSAQGSWEGSHIKADFLSAFITSGSVRRFFVLLVMGIETGVLAVLVALGAYMVWENIAQYPRWSATVAWRIPFLVPHFGIFLGFSLMLLFSALRLKTAWCDPDAFNPDISEGRAP